MMMRYGALRYGVLLVVLALPLSGCLEVLGAKMNRGPSVTPCIGANGQPTGNVCTVTPPAPN
jgi:hypothetical protein